MLLLIKDNLVGLSYRFKFKSNFQMYSTINSIRASLLLRLTRNVEVVSSSPIKGPSCFLEQETLPLLLSTGWFQERIRA